MPQRRCSRRPTSSASACPTAASAGWPRARPPVLDDAGRPARRVGVNWDVTEASDAELARQQAVLAERESQRQVAVPLAHEPRAAHAAQRGARLHAAAADRGAPVGRRGAARQARAHPRRRRPPAVADQRRARPVEPRDRRAPAGAAARSTSASWCAQSVPLVQSLAAQHGVALEIGDGSTASPAADPTRLRQVLINLLSNAIKYNRRGGRVRGRGRSRRRARRRCAVRDTGRGLTREQLAQPVRAVQPLRRRERRHRGHRHRPDDRQGAGRAHGRHASRCSSKPGDGTRVRRARCRPRRRPTRADAADAEAATGAGACERAAPRARRARSSTSRTTRSTCCSSRSWCAASAASRSSSEATGASRRRARARRCGPTWS